jgi:pimeloyl-ACP methyl ester carboxylesterase
MPYFTTDDGTRLHYRVAGKGRPTLLFIHGWCSNLEHWEPQARAFTRRHRVVRVDLRGHGRSDAPAKGYTIRGFADDVAALARSLRVRSAVVVGHSMGGRVALELARRHRERFRALVLVDTPLVLAPAAVAGQFVEALEGPDYPAPLGEFFARFFSDASDRNLAARVVAEAMRTPQHAAAGAMRGLLAFNSAAAAKRVRQPALFVAAAQAAARWDALRELLPQVQFARVVGAGHFLQLEAPEQFNAMLRRFVERL